MPILQVRELTLHYEEWGEGFPLLLFAPGGMRSEITLWQRRPGVPDQSVPWIDPTADLSGSFRVIAFDQRNAGSSSAPVGAGDSWTTYALDAVALLDHLGVERCHLMGGCIGSSYVLGLVEAAPGRVAAAVLQNPIGLTADNRSAFYSMFDEWAAAIGPQHPEASPSVWRSFREAMFGGEFVFSVAPDFVSRCPVPLLILPGADTFHPAEVAHRIAELAPSAQVLEPWSGEEHKPAVRQAVRAFLESHTR